MLLWTVFLYAITPSKQRCDIGGDQNKKKKRAYFSACCSVAKLILDELISLHVTVWNPKPLSHTHCYPEVFRTSPTRSCRRMWTQMFKSLGLEFILPANVWIEQIIVAFHSFILRLRKNIKFVSNLLIFVYPGLFFSLWYQKGYWVSLFFFY